MVLPPQDPEHPSLPPVPSFPPKLGVSDYTEQQDDIIIIGQDPMVI